jgi:hypothetical protein
VDFQPNKSAILCCLSQALGQDLAYLVDVDWLLFTRGRQSEATTKPRHVPVGAFFCVTRNGSGAASIDSKISSAGQTTHRHSGIKLLGDRDKGHIVLVEQLHQLCKISQTAPVAADQQRLGLHSFGVTIVGLPIKLCLNGIGDACPLKISEAPRPAAT